MLGGAELEVKKRRLKKSRRTRPLRIEEEDSDESGGLTISLGEEEAMEEKVDDLKKEEEVINICEVCGI